MDFAVLPPEVNSARMYAGPGSGPMLTVALAWDELAAALHSTANSYQAEVSALTEGPWLGPSSASMAAAIAPYLEWMRATGTQAEQTATQARAAATAYEMAFAETVPPPVVAANRTLLAALVASNFLGQNTPAIATTETQYGEMWAQDAAAMYGYAGAAASATTLTPFTPPQQTSNSSNDQSQAVAQASGTAAGRTQNVVSSAQQSISAVPNVLTNLATPAAAAADPSSALNGLDFLSDLIAIFIDVPSGLLGIGVDTPLTAVSFPYDIMGAYTGFHTDDIISGWAGVQSWPGTGAIPPTSFPVLMNVPGRSALSAGLGQANTIGSLSVPPGWAAAAPAIRPAALALPATTVGAAAQVSAASATTGTGSLFGEMAAASMAGRAMGSTTGLGRPAERARADTQKATREQSNEQTKDGAAVPQVAAGGPITSIAAELRELASLRDAGILTQQEFEEQKQRLLPH